MTIPVLINGAQGRMGQACVKAISNDPSLYLVGQTSKLNDLADIIRASEAKVVVDFTNANVVARNLEIIIGSGAHPVVGTSGLLGEQIKAYQTQCAEKKLGGIIAPNFSLGAVLMMKCAQEVAKYFSHVEIIEMHHDGKLDSPSGTSIYTAEMIAKNLQSVMNTKNVKENIPGARGATYQNIPIHAVRLPGLVAHEQIIFGALGETLTIKHDSIDRECFMPGVVLACKKVVELQELMYGLETIL